MELANKQLLSIKLAGTIVLLSLISLFSFKVQLDKAENNIKAISRFTETQKTLSAFQAERTKSIKKVLEIISRYNNDMEAETKKAIANEIYEMSQKYTNINVDFICATITHESANTWDPQITSKVGAMGLMQIMPATGAFMAVKEGVQWSNSRVLYDPIVNIRLGCRYLSEMVRMYEHDGGLAAYNGGPKRAEMWLASNRNNKMLFAETREYVPAVLKLYRKFQSQKVL